MNKKKWTLAGRIAAVAAVVLFQAITVAGGDP